MPLTLEQRARKAREELFARYDQLNALWLKAEEQIAKYHIPHAVEYIYAPDDHPNDPTDSCLGVVKIKGQWRICHGYYRPAYEPFAYEWTPITECAAAIRVQVVKHI